MRPEQIVQPSRLSRAASYSRDLRERIDRLVEDVAGEPTSSHNLRERAETLWVWVNAFARRGGVVPAECALVCAGVLSVGPEQTLVARSSEDIARRVDGFVRELQLKEVAPGTPGTLAFGTSRPLRAGEFVTIEQTFVCGPRGMATGGALLVAKLFMADHGEPQYLDPEGDNYTTLRPSRPGAVFEPGTISLRGMFGGFRRKKDVLVWRLVEGDLAEGDTVTVTYGDRSQGSRGFQVQSYTNDGFALPVLADIEGQGNFLTPRWPVYEVVGGPAEDLHVFVPPVVRVGSEFSIWLRTEDHHRNRATGTVPAYRVFLDDEQLAEVPSGADALSVVDHLRVERPGTYRLRVEASGGLWSATSDPFWAETDPTEILCWGEMHGHCGYAEGQGTPDGYFRFGRDDARLDFLSLSEHDVFLDDGKWQVLQDCAERYSTPGFVPILGYEWTAPPSLGGHHNVYFLHNDRERVPLQAAASPHALFAELLESNEEQEILVIPHAHQAADWREADDSLVRLVEIHSQHGSFEWFAKMYLRSGHDVGFIGGSDNHQGHPGYAQARDGVLESQGGLAAVRVATKTRPEIFASLRALRTYATSGERMLLRFDLNGAEMGSHLPWTARRRLTGRVSGTAPLSEVSVVKNGGTFWTHTFGGEVTGGECWMEVCFASSSEAFVHDNPRGYRVWRGVLSVQEAVVEAVDGRGLFNRHREHAELVDAERGRVRFEVRTRGHKEGFLLKLAGCSERTTVAIEVEESIEVGAVRYLRHPAPTPGERVDFAMPEIAGGAASRDLKAGEHVDSIAVQVVDPCGALDFDLDVLDEVPEPAGYVGSEDYYYLRVRQVGGAMAWSSPIWVAQAPATSGPEESSGRVRRGAP